ncbi:hypothetical protein GQ457_07G014700 [Hibiscus cannabinus]
MVTRDRGSPRALLFLVVFLDSDLFFHFALAVFDHPKPIYLAVSLSRFLSLLTQLRVKLFRWMQRQQIHWKRAEEADIRSGFVKLVACKQDSHLCLVRCIPMVMNHFSNETLMTRPPSGACLRMDLSQGCKLRNLSYISYGVSNLKFNRSKFLSVVAFILFMLPNKGSLVLYIFLLLLLFLCFWDLLFVHHWYGDFGCCWEFRVCDGC